MHYYLVATATMVAVIQLVVDYQLMAHCNPFTEVDLAVADSITVAFVIVSIASAACKLIAVVELNNHSRLIIRVYVLTSHVCHRHE